MEREQQLQALQRQRSCLRALPSGFAFPLFNAARAIQSQRSSGYRSTAAAAREIVDNAVEAGAEQIHVLFRTRREGRRRLVDAVAFIDNGSGMLAEMARYALSWGGGTHFDAPAFIGKFGFGLPNASINQARRVEVYTRTGPDGPFAHVWLDVRDIARPGEHSVAAPVPAAPPEFVRRYLERQGLALEHGTIVVWADPDRLTYKMPANLREHLLDDFGVVYRYLLADAGRPLTLVVEGGEVQPIDPLFLLPQGRWHLPEGAGGAQLVERRRLSVRYGGDAETGESRLTLLPDGAPPEPADPNLLARGEIAVQVARFPLGFAEPRDTGRWPLLPHAAQRFEVRKPRRGMSFVRAGREIETVDAFPRSARDVAAGLGRWPLLQGYAYHWGVEVRFGPELDEVFGITNDKQGVRPIEDFWRVLAQAGIDDCLHRENAEQSRRRARMAFVAPADLPAPAQGEAHGSGTASGRTAEMVGLGRREAAIEGTAPPASRIEYADLGAGPLYEPQWLDGQVLVRINRQHPFCALILGDRGDRRGNGRTAVELLVLALGAAELRSEGETRRWYAQQRTQHWGGLLDALTRESGRRLLPAGREGAG